MRMTLPYAKLRRHVRNDCRWDAAYASIRCDATRAIELFELALHKSVGRCARMHQGSRSVDAAMFVSASVVRNP